MKCASIATLFLPSSLPDLGWHVALLWPACGPDLANRSGPPKGRQSLLHVGQIRIPQVPDMGRIWAETMLLCIN